MGEVKRYDPNYAAMSPADDLAVEAEDGVFVMATDYATLEAENAKLRAELERRPVDGWKMVPVERITIALESVQNAMEDAYNNAYQECCGLGQGQCCGDPVAAWSDADTAIMDALAPAQRELSALLAAAPSAPKADDPVKVQLLEALEAAEKKLCIAEYHLDKDEDDSVVFESEILQARAAIAAARQEGGKV